MNLNLESEIVFIDPTQWTLLQTEITMRIARAKLEAFADESARLAEAVRYGLLTSALATDYLHEAAAYNQLYFEYGADHIQAIMATAFDVEAA